MKRLFCSTKRVLLISIVENKQDLQILSRIIAAYFFASVLCQFADKPLRRLFVMPFTKAATAWRIKNKNVGRVLRLSPPYHISMLQMSSISSFLWIFTRGSAGRQEENIFQMMTCASSRPPVTAKCRSCNRLFSLKKCLERSSPLLLLPGLIVFLFRKMITCTTSWTELPASTRILWISTMCMIKIKITPVWST